MSIDPNSNVELLTVAEVAEQLRISVSGVRRLQQARQLPFIKVGGSIRFFKSDIFAYLKKQRVGSIG
jgi:excisionase family DNA binding protein